MNNKMTVACNILLLMVIGKTAPAQVNTGSVIVFVPEQDKFIVASDSRGGYVRGAHLQSDGYCKVATFKGNIVFASAGAFAYESSGIDDPIPGWTNLGEAAAVAKVQESDTRTADTIINAIADNWAQSLATKWSLIYERDPQIVIKVAKEPDRTLTSGIFAIARGGEIAFAARDLVLNGRKIETHQFRCGMDHICGYGHTEVFLEFTRQTSDRSVAEAKSWSLSPASDSIMKAIDPRSLYVIRLVDLTIAYDSSGTVGGGIDALELWRDGSVHWIQRKENCPAGE